jgi:hypothetical protein
MGPLVGLAAAIAFACPIASEAVTIQGQARSVAASVHILDFMEPPSVVDSETATASDLGPFQESVSAQSSSPVQPFSAIGRATQDSSFTTETPGVLLAADAAGDADAGAQHPGIFPTDIGSSGDSRFEITFEVDVPLHFELLASIQGTGAGIGSASASVELLDGDAELLASLSRSVSNGSFDLSRTFTGLLDPGTYTLRARAFAGAGANRVVTRGFGDASFGLALLVVPESATASLLAIGLLALAARRRRGP